MAEPIAGAINRTLLSDQVYDLVKARLLSHQYPPGARLVESEIARQLSVSQAPVRDALRLLSHEGLVLQLPRRGSFVAEFSPEEARDAFELRARLEGLAVSGMLAHLTGPLLSGLEGYIADMLTAATADDMDSFVDADMKFHRTVWEASQNRFLPKVWPLLEATMRNMMQVSNRLYFDNLTDIAQTHYPLVAGLRAHDPTVGALFEDHALQTWKLIVAEQQKTGRPKPAPRQ